MKFKIYLLETGTHKSHGKITESTKIYHQYRTYSTNEMLPPALICDQPLDNDNGLSVIKQSANTSTRYTNNTDSAESTDRNSNSILQKDAADKLTLRVACSIFVLVL